MKRNVKVSNAAESFRGRQKKDPFRVQQWHRSVDNPNGERVGEVITGGTK